MNRNVKRVLSILSRLSFDTHLWCVSVIGGAILLCISFFANVDNRQLSYVVNNGTNRNISDHTIEYSSVLGNIGIPSQDNSTAEVVVADGIVDEQLINGIEEMHDATELVEFIPEVIEANAVIEQATEEAVNDVVEIDVEIQDSFSEDVLETDISDMGLESDAETECVTIAEDTESSVDINSQYTIEEIELLNKLVQCEAQTEDLEGRRLIANVVLNRVDVGIWGNSIESVIKAPGQFHPVKRGGINRAVVDDVTREAVMQALNGVDESSGALYFQKSKSKVWGKKIYLFRHGSHSFYL